MRANKKEKKPGWNQLGTRTDVRRWADGWKEHRAVSESGEQGRRPMREGTANSSSGVNSDRHIS